MTSGGLVHIAGQVAVDEDGEFVSELLVPQVRKALANVIAVLSAAGGTPADIASMTWYIDDRYEFTNDHREIRRILDETFGERRPPMSVIDVDGMLDDEALVMIEAVADLGR